MIEMVYSSKETEELSEVRVPKNIHQIGDVTSSRKIYVEDYVMTSLKKNPDNENGIKYGVLLGEIKRAKGNSYVFVKGLVETREVIENSIIFSDDIWSAIYKDTKKYFEGYEIIGWFVSVPYTVKNDMSSIQKLHLDNFAGNDKVCYLSDRTEKEDGFFAYEDGSLKKESGYYIFYEKNEKMKKYLKQTQGNRSVVVAADKPAGDIVVNETARNNDLIQERGASAKTNLSVHTEKVNQRVQPANKTQALEKRQMSFRDVIKEQVGDERGKLFKSGGFAYAISSMLIVALLMSTVVMLNNYGELKSLKSSIENMSGADSVEAMNEMLSSIMPTTVESDENSDGDSNTEVKPTDENQLATENEVENIANATEGKVQIESINGDEYNYDEAEDAASEGNSSEDNELDEDDNSGNDDSDAYSEDDLEDDYSENNVYDDSSDEVYNAAGASTYSGTYHTVTAGQTLYDISISYYGNSNMVEKIKEVNSIDDDYMIQEGQQLLLP